VEEPEELNTENPQVFKKPADISPSEFKRPRYYHAYKKNMSHLLLVFAEKKKGVDQLERSVV
jgi:hypothetical protein